MPAGALGARPLARLGGEQGGHGGQGPGRAAAPPTATATAVRRAQAAAATAATPPADILRGHLTPCQSKPGRRIIKCRLGGR